MLALRFVTLDAPTVGHILTDPAGYQRQTGIVFDPHTEQIVETLQMTSKLFSQNAADVPWVAYLAVRAADGVAVGSCGFKHAPRADGSVEFGYGTYPAFENQGVATAMAAEMVRIARAGGAKTAVAHTLPVKNASGRVLTKAGFRFAGDAFDPEDGPVWRWEHPLG
jgi:RimJ/RimL family protein N-acetyltransferase